MQYLHESSSPYEVNNGSYHIYLQGFGTKNRLLTLMTHCYCELFLYCQKTVIIL